jgi:hypothetical protein
VTLQSAEIVAAQGSNRIRGYPDGGIPCGIGKNLKDSAIPGWIVGKKSFDRSQKRLLGSNLISSAPFDSLRSLMVGQPQEEKGPSRSGLSDDSKQSPNLDL